MIKHVLDDQNDNDDDGEYDFDDSADIEGNEIMIIIIMLKTPQYKIGQIMSYHAYQSIAETIKIRLYLNKSMTVYFTTLVSSLFTPIVLLFSIRSSISDPSI